MKTQEELKALKEEFEILNSKLKELTEEELKEVSGGFIPILFSQKYAGSFIGAASDQTLRGTLKNGGIRIGDDSFCQYYAFCDSTNKTTYGHTCYGGSIKGTLPICATCPANINK